MKRTTSTAKTRGQITRIITVTKCVLRCYDSEMHETSDYEIELSGAVNEKSVIHRVYSTGVLDKKRFTVLEILSYEQTGTLYAMDVETFIKHASVIETGITD